MSEWLGKSKIEIEDIKNSCPSIVKYFPMLTRFYVDNQKMRIHLILEYDEGKRFREAVLKKYGSFSPQNVRRSAKEALIEWIEKTLGD